MKRRTFLQGIAVVTALPVISLYVTGKISADTVNSVLVEPLDKPHDAWRNLVSPEAYKVLFEEQTELSGSSVLNHEHRQGTFICAACYLPLF